MVLPHSHAQQSRTFDTVYKQHCSSNISILFNLITYEDCYYTNIYTVFLYLLEITYLCGSNLTILAPSHSVQNLKECEFLLILSTVQIKVLYFVWFILPQIFSARWKERAMTWTTAIETQCKPTLMFYGFLGKSSPTFKIESDVKGH